MTSRNAFPINRREFLTGSALSMAAAVAGTARAGKKPAGPAGRRRPNIVFILADDMGYGDPGCYNADSKVPTPNIDALAAAGMRFTDAHAPGSVCVPTRYGLMTGRYPFRTAGGRRGLRIERGRMTIASLLKRAGYHTACVGKWHLGFEGEKNPPADGPLRGGPVDCGFDEYFGIPASLDIPPYYYIRNDRCVARPTEKIEPSHSAGWRGIQGAFWRGGGVAPGFKHAEVLPTFLDKSIGILTEHARQRAEKPLLLYLALAAPHTPWLPAKAFGGKSRASMYGDFVHQVDHAVGRLLTALETLGLSENTLVIFSSDNGPVWYPDDVERLGHSAVGPLRGMKGDAWEGGHRMPFIARWPGQVAPGSISHEPICLTDLLATFAAITGQALPDEAGEDSFSILPVLLGEKRRGPVREAIIHHGRRLSIRKGQWKLIPFLGSGGFSAPRNVKPGPGDPAGQLYNLSDDLGERNNLYLEHGDVVSELAKLLERYRRDGRSRAASKRANR